MSIARRREKSDGYQVWRQVGTVEPEKWTVISFPGHLTMKNDSTPSEAALPVYLEADTSQTSPRCRLRRPF
jgi:hypothetical protein